MRFFSRSKNRLSSYRQGQYEKKEFIVSMTDRDYSGMQLCDTTLKVWLPENIMRILYEVTVLQDITISDFIRQLLFIHLYGRYDFLGFMERNSPEHTDPDSISPCAKTASTEETESSEPIALSSVSNKVIAFKICLPATMKQDLHALAEKKHLPISEYVRNIISTNLLGHQK